MKIILSTSIKEACIKLNRLEKEILAKTMSPSLFLVYGLSKEEIDILNISDSCNHIINRQKPQIPGMDIDQCRMYYSLWKMKHRTFPSVNSEIQFMVRNSTSMSVELF